MKNPLGRLESVALRECWRTEDRDYTGKVILNWMHERRVALRLIDPGKTNQSAFGESYSGRLRDESFNEHWFISPNAHALIGGWR